MSPSRKSRSRAVAHAEVLGAGGNTIRTLLPVLRCGEPAGWSMPCGSLKEHRLFLWLEFHPLVDYWLRADALPEFYAIRGVKPLIRTPIEVPYTFEEKSRIYKPDAIARLVTGRAFLAEAGEHIRKRDPESRAKAEAAIAWAAEHNASFGIGTELTISDRRYQTMERLGGERVNVPYDEATVSELTALFRRVEPVTIEGAGERLARGDRAAAEIERVAWRLTAEALAAGRLAIDVDLEVIGRRTPIRLTPDGAPIILPPELPSILDPIAEAAARRTVIDASTLEPAERESFLKKQTANRLIMEGASYRTVSDETGIPRSTLEERHRLFLDKGDRAFLGKAGVARGSGMAPEFQAAAYRLFAVKRKVGARHVLDSDEFAAVQTQLEAEGRVGEPPSYWATYRLLRRFAADPNVEDLRESTSHGQKRWSRSTVSYVRALTYPAQVVQVDEHYMDVLLTTVSGLEFTNRIYCAVLICVKTAAPLAAVLSPNRINEDDVKRLLKMAMEDKTELARAAGCENPWDCRAKPMIYLTDNGHPLETEETLDTLGRFFITTQLAPRDAPTVKGTAEAIFGVMERMFGHRFPYSTLGDPDRLGGHDPGAEAQKAGVVFEEFEKWFYRALIDGYWQGPDSLRGAAVRSQLWYDSVDELGVPDVGVTEDELKLLLMRRLNPKNPVDPRYVYTTSGINLWDLDYRTDDAALLYKLRKARACSIRFDPRDITWVHAYGRSHDETGTSWGSPITRVRGEEYLGPIHATRFPIGMRLSLAEWDKIRAHEEEAFKVSRLVSRKGYNNASTDVGRTKPDRRKVAKRAQRVRVDDGRVDEMHTEVVQRMRTDAIERELQPAPEIPKVPVVVKLDRADEKPDPSYATRPRVLVRRSDQE